MRQPGRAIPAARRSPLKYKPDLSLVAALLALWLLIPREAHAYLDPGSVSLFFQALAAALLGGLLVVKRYWDRIVDGLRRLLRTAKHDED